MLPIPSYLMDKVKQAMQTIGNNAEPKMTILAQKAAKFLTQGSFLNPRTIRTGNSLGPLDICIRREDYMQEPTEIVMVYIENGLAKVATLPYVHTPDIYFTYQYTIGPATDVACDFDGPWHLITDRSDLYYDTETIWALQTFGEPYIVIVNEEKELTVQIGQAIATLLASDVIKCSILRGFKSVLFEYANDQGLIIVYIKTDGKVYYRNYCEQEDHSFIWEIEREIIDFTSLGLATSINLFRTNDYRVGIMAEISNNITLLLSERSWSGMAILPEMGFSLPNIEAFITRLQITYQSNTAPNEAMFTIINPFIERYSLTPPVLRNAWNIATEIYDEELEEYYNDYGYVIVFEFNQEIVNADSYPDQFKIIDSYNTQWNGQTAIVNGRFVTVTFNNFNNAENLITAKALSGYLSNGYALINEISCTFNLINLVPYYIAPPVPLSIEIIEDWSG